MSSSLSDYNACVQSGNVEFKITLRSGDRNHSGDGIQERNRSSSKEAGRWKPSMSHSSISTFIHPEGKTHKKEFTFQLQVMNKIEYSTQNFNFAKQSLAIEI